MKSQILYLELLLAFSVIFICMTKIKVNAKTRYDVIRAYEAREMSLKKLTEKFGLSERVFYRILKEEGVVLKQRPKNYLRPPKHNLTGKRYFHLLVIRMEITKKSRDRSWRTICRCDCGRIADVNTNYLMRGLVKTCGSKVCQYHRQDYSNNGKNNIRFSGYEEISGQLWASYKCGAKRRNIKFNISIKKAWNLFLEQNKKCALTGRDIYFGRTNLAERTASLDRIDSSIGYIEGNVQWVHKDINKMKMDLNVFNFIKLCKEVCDWSNFLNT